MQPPDGPPASTALKRRPSLHPAADVLDDLADRDAHGHFDEAAALDLAGQREDLRALRGRGAEGGKRLGTVAEDPRQRRPASRRC